MSPNSYQRLPGDGNDGFEPVKRRDSYKPRIAELEIGAQTEGWGEKRNSKARNGDGWL